MITRWSGADVSLTGDLSSESGHRSGDYLNCQMVSQSVGIGKSTIP